MIQIILLKLPNICKKVIAFLIELLTTQALFIKLDGQMKIRKRNKFLVTVLI